MEIRGLYQIVELNISPVAKEQMFYFLLCMHSQCCLKKFFCGHLQSKATFDNAPCKLEPIFSSKRSMKVVTFAYINFMHRIYNSKNCLHFYLVGIIFITFCFVRDFDSTFNVNKIENVMSIVKH